MSTFSGHDFHPVIELPEDYDILELNIPPAQRAQRTSTFSVGRYNEVRPDTYQDELFAGTRNIHMGIDIGAPVGTTVHARACRWVRRPADGAVCGRRAGRRTSGV